jgi:hypothetical protein
VEDDDIIDMPALVAALTEATAKGGPFSMRSLSLQATREKNADFVRDILRGQSNNPDLRGVMGVARLLGRDISTFLKTSSISSGPKLIKVVVKGCVEAGAWRSHEPWAPDDWYAVEFEEDGIFGTRVGLEVRGRSMELRFPEGTALDCVMLIGSNAIVDNGDYVVVEAIRGGLYERTCKRLSLRPDGNFELIAESTQPEFADPIFIGKPDFYGPSEDEIRVVGKVLHAKQSFVTRRKIRLVQ